MTIIQDGQTYAIPASDYAAMMAQQGIDAVDPQGSEQPASTAPATSSTTLTESLALPSTPLPPTIPHLTPCPPPTLAQVSTNLNAAKTESQAGRSGKMGQAEAGKSLQGIKGRANASVGTEELKGSAGPGAGGVGGVGDGGPSMRWTSATAPPAGSRAVKQEQKRQIYPTMQQVLQGFPYM